MNADHQHFVYRPNDQAERSRPIVLEGGGFGMRWSVAVAKRFRDELDAAINQAELRCICNDHDDPRACPTHP